MAHSFVIGGLMKYKSTIILATVLAALAGCSSEEPIPTGNPKKNLEGGVRGYKAPHGIVAGQKTKVYWMHQVVSDFDSGNPKILPASIETVDTNINCRFAPVSAEHSFMNGSVDASKGYSQIFSFDMDTLIERADRVVKRIQEGRAPFPNRRRSSGIKGHPIVDVIITESEKPVYLVLNSRSSVIWNFHLGKRVQLAQVVILSKGEAGVVNLNENVPLTILNQQASKNCKIFPSRKPADHWRFTKKHKKSRTSNGKIYDSYLQEHETFNRWFIRRFGFGYEKEHVGLNHANHLVFGPIPQIAKEKVPYKTIKGRTVRVTPNDFIFSANEEQALKMYLSKIDQVVQTRTGKTISELQAQN